MIHHPCGIGLNTSNLIATLMECIYRTFVRIVFIKQYLTHIAAEPSPTIIGLDISHIHIIAI